MKTILVATDFSPSAKNAANYAADMALTIKADLLLLYVHQIPVALDVEDMMEEIKECMNELKERLIRRTGGKLNIETDVRRGICFYDELEIACENVKPYTVIVGSQDTTASECLFFGHTVHAMKHLRWPLITVPRGATFSSIRKIRVACDFDKVIDTTPIDESKILVNDLNAKLHILNTVKNERLTSEAVY
jgi:nucleotide-binding universal stress UspA family protein